MKKIYLSCFTALMGAVALNAQPAIENEEKTSVINIVAEYDFLNVEAASSWDSDAKMHGFSIGVNYDGGTFQKKGMAASIGLQFYDYYYKGKSTYSDPTVTLKLCDESIYMGGIKIPIKIGYTIPIGSAVRITPYIGGSIMLNMYGTMKINNINWHNYAAITGDIETSEIGVSTCINSLNSSPFSADLGEQKWNRVMLPLQVGLNIDIMSKFDIAVRYEKFTSDFGICDAWGASVMLGYRF